MSAIAIRHQTQSIEKYGLPTKNEMSVVAERLVTQTAGTIAGIDPNGNLTGKSWHKGTLTNDQAAYVTQFALSRGLNPFTDVHVWYFQKLQVCEHYSILAGWAQLRQPYTDQYREVADPAERAKHKLQKGDVAAVCTILKRDDQGLFISCIQAGMDAQTALGIAGTSAIGVVKSPEMNDKDGKSKEIDVKGWTWLQRAETRALRNALKRSHGSPTLAEIKSYQENYNPHATPEVLAHRDYDPALPQNVQQKQSKLIANHESHRAEVDQMTDAEFTEYNEDVIKPAIDLMRDDGDDLDLDEIEPDEPKQENDMQEVFDARESLKAKAEKSEVKGFATKVQASVITDKLGEYFAPADDAKFMGLAVLEWLFDTDDPNKLKKSESTALLGWILLRHDKETGEYVIRQDIAPVIRKMYEQTQIDAGQLGLF